MKHTTFLVAILASAVAAGVIEQRGGPPKCAMKCIKDNLKSSGCGKKDFKCMCTSEPLYKAAVPCVKNKCNKQDIQKTADWVEKSCRKVTGGGK